MTFAPVAVVAAECILPGTEGFDDFERVNYGAESMIGHAPDSFWEGCDALAEGTACSDLGGFVPRVRLDSSKYRLPPRTLAEMDPSHALALETARRLMVQVERQGDLPRSETAVILANVSGGRDTQMRLAVHLESLKWAEGVRARAPALSRTLDAYRPRVEGRFPHRGEDCPINGDSGTIAGRIAHHFDLTGSHFTVDAACAGSIAALHSACLGLSAGSYDAAIVGGVGRLDPDTYAVNTSAGSMSTTGCRPFAADADGLVHGEGSVMVFLVRLADAVERGRPVLGVLRAVGHSVNARLTTGWAPSAPAEAVAIRRAFDGVDFAPSDVCYVEAHGTSTELGDAAEFKAMQETYGGGRRDRPLPFGSAKSIFGHTVETAGLVGLLRGLSVIRTRRLPSTVGVTEVHPAVRADRRFTLQRDSSPAQLPAAGPLRVGVSAFGYGGLNYHLLVEEGPGPEPAARPGVATSRAAVSTPAEAEPIAVVAMNFIGPDCSNVDEFWSNLRQGRVSSADVRDWIPAFDFYWADPERRSRTTYLDRAAPAAAAPFTDNVRFRITPHRASTMTPEMLLLLRCLSGCADAVQRSAHTVDQYRAGVFVGEIPDSDRAIDLMCSVRFRSWLEDLRVFAGAAGSDVDWDQLGHELRASPAMNLGDVDQDTSVAGFGSTLASTLCEALDFRGKALTVRAACATSLAALHLAVQDLRAGVLDYAVCGATSWGQNLTNHTSLAAIGALSHRGESRPYDADGDGFIIGAGGGVLGLKRLRDAERDGDTVRALIREVAGSGDGHGQSLLAPSASGRRLAMERAYTRAAIPAESISYIEGHGAATPMGDATELDSIRTARGTDHPLWLGSVKGNVGHLKAAAGLAALVKTISCLENETLVPTPGFRRPRGSLRIPASQITVVSAPTPWSGPHRRAGVSAFGLGGINFHAVLESYDGRAPGHGAPHGWRFWAGSTREDLTQSVAAHPSGTPLPGLADQPDRAAVWETGAVPVDRRVELLVGALRRTGPAGLDGLAIHAGTRSDSRVCFLFPGQGSQYPGMLRGVAARLPTLTRRLAEAKSALGDLDPHFEENFWAREPAETSAWLARTRNCQPATLLTSIIMHDWLVSIGITADLYLGHSFGELCALVAAGAISFQDGMVLAHRRGQIAEETGDGADHAMAVLSAPGDLAEHLCAGIPLVACANFNSPVQTVVSGERAAVGQVVEGARRAGAQARVIPVSRAFHSPLMDAAATAYRKVLAPVELATPAVPVYDGSTARLYPPLTTGAEIRQALADQLTAPVNYRAMIEDAWSRGARTFIEVGPKSALTTLAEENLGQSQVSAIPLIHPKGGEDRSLTRAAVRLWTDGRIDAAQLAATLSQGGRG
jgi:acyl transferase domain-containing protein